MKKTIFYLAGCPVYPGAEYDILSLIGKGQIEGRLPGEDRSRIAEAEKTGVNPSPPCSPLTRSRYKSSLKLHWPI